MRRRALVFAPLLSLLFAFSSCDTLQQVATQGGLPGTSGTPTATEVNAGLKQALQLGIQDGVKQVSAVNGFFGDAMIKILFPPEARKVESTLRNLGLNKLCDDVILSLNRAAENAAKEATPIFTTALSQMSFNDVMNILLGADTAATSYFRRATTAQLQAKFKPVIAQSLSQVGATRYWSDLMGQYNRIPLVKPVNPDLSAYVTDRAIDGLFTMIAQKEVSIRSRLGARSTPLLKKVFGYAEAQQAGAAR